MNSLPLAFEELFASSLARYGRVLPSGIQLPHHGRTLSSFPAQILTWRPARTLYENRQPRCRSLDAIQSLSEGRSCASCLMRKRCTPQIYLELLYEQVPYRLLLAYTSARNFLQFNSQLRQKGQPIERAAVVISVRDRGRWGEVRFLSPP